jgi:pimeloyl-ACP methyl ester carboxylesterase
MPFYWSSDQHYKRKIDTGGELERGNCVIYTNLARFWRETMFIQNHSAQLYTVDFGSGPRTLLAQGGWTGSWELWTEPLQGLSKSWRTVAYDHRGTGATVAPVDSITMENMVDDLFAVMDNLNIEKCILAAESAGGMVAVQAVLQQPQRFEGLVLVDALLHREESEGIAGFVQALKMDYSKTIEQFVNACVPETEPNCGEVRNWGRKILFRASPESAIQLIQCTYGIDLRSRLAQIPLPTLILHGDQDAIVPLSDSEFAATQIPVNHFHVFQATGHVPTMTRPLEVAEQIRQYFLDDER